jgi:uncharacterized protein (TIGR00299 family) protein
MSNSQPEIDGTLPSAMTRAAGPSGGRAMEHGSEHALELAQVHGAEQRAEQRAERVGDHGGEGAAKSDTLLIEPFGGLAGDMFLAALLDLKDPRFTLEELRAMARELVPGEASFEAETVWRGSLSGLCLSVRTEESDSTPHRGYRDLAALLEHSSLPAPVVARACAVLWRIAVAEGRVHGCAPEQIHFHEIGAVDSLVDVAGACLALERLGVRRLFSTPPLVGSGSVRCAHGDMPVPAPAVAELLRGREMRLGGEGERLTPTGAALLAEFTADFGPPAAFRCESIGYGAGRRDPRTGPPNIARVQLGSAGAARSHAGRDDAARVVELECNLDDLDGEAIGFLVGELRARGALEVWTAGVSMKKDRPGVLLTALCRESRREALEDGLFEHSTTLGVRWSLRERTECERRAFSVELDGAVVRGQRRIRPRVPVGAAPTARDVYFEFDDLAALARSTKRSLREVELACLQLALERLRDG